MNEGHYANILLKYLLEIPELDEAFRGSDGLCLTHLGNTLARARSRSAAAALVDAQRSVLQRLDGELSEFIRKNDHRFRHERFGAEEDAWLRALETVSGAAPRRGHDAALTQALP
ncbi:MAG: hypothetical protein HC802_03340 [Caldilineaceae bacterium]|nr:hypothetical protein [Caldilineaceae bacterium]